MNNLNSIIKLIISLGNPGKKYEFTRHNAGHLVLENLELKITNEKLNKLANLEINSDVKVFKSDTFMNDSGVFVSKKLKYYKIKPEELLIIHDDLDLKLGEHKLQFATGPKVHNGILDIEQKLKTKNFWRLRIGIDNRTQDQKKFMSGVDYVLEEFSKEELEIIYTIGNKIIKI